MKMISVRASRNYDVVIEGGCLDEVGDRLCKLFGRCTAAVVSDDTVFSLYGATVVRSLEEAGLRAVPYVFPHGEQSKNLTVYGELLNFLAESRLTRSDVLVALGGGVVGDLAGFAAATYLRGIAFVQLPTTLLAAVDSSVGGKTAVDLPAGKNLAGAFCQPSLVLCDTKTLSTLPEDTFRDGCAEVIKYGLLSDETFFRSLQKTPLRKQLERGIAVCVQSKSDYVNQDEFDRGKRQFLNLGHSFGHAVEARSGYTLSHGKCVAIGMAMITRAAYEKGFCGESTLSDVLAVLRQYGLPTESPYGSDELLRALTLDKKISGGSLHLIVPEAVGRCRMVSVPLSELPDWLAAGGAK